MLITHITLENWRNFTHVDVSLQRRVFIAGANAAGKSNLLDAPASSATSPRPAVVWRRQSPTVAVSRRSVASRRDGTPRSCSTCNWENLPTTPSGGTASASFRTTSASRRSRRNESSATARKCSNGRTPTMGKTPSGCGRHTLEGTNTNKFFRDIYRFFNSIRYLHVLPPSGTPTGAIHWTRANGRNIRPRFSGANCPQQAQDSAVAAPANRASAAGRGATTWRLET